MKTMAKKPEDCNSCKYHFALQENECVNEDSKFYTGDIFKADRLAMLRYKEMFPLMAYQCKEYRRSASFRSDTSLKNDNSIKLDEMNEILMEKGIIPYETKKD
jgi:hypothetical protein